MVGVAVGAGGDDDFVGLRKYAETGAEVVPGPEPEEDAEEGDD